jgi:shikimate kinase
MVGKSFVDADEEIVKTEGRTISDIFSIDGEGYFRAAEKKIISDLATINSHVIATGGGAVLDRDNMDILKENGRVYFINRPLNELISTDDRPLSNSRESLEKRYNERYSLYISSADVVIDGSGSIEEVAKRIEADFIEYLCD